MDIWQNHILSTRWESPGQYHSPDRFLHQMTPTITIATTRTAISRITMTMATVAPAPSLAVAGGDDMPANAWDNE